MKNLIIGTAGHVDHGKTTLVRALTGINTDRLEEEQRRGITIEIGFAHMDLGEFRIGFIDVPGHEKFVKNMLAGIGGIDLLMLVVAADESVMPQTVEHFEICRLLGIPRGLIVITKAGLVDEELVLLVQEEVRDLVQGSFLEGAPVVAVDSLSGEGLEELQETLAREIERLDRSRKDEAKAERLFRMPVDRVFSVRGFGTVVTGTALAGHLSKDATVGVYPGGKTAKVRGIEIFNEESSQAAAGQRTALNLSGLQKDDVIRGMQLSVASGLEPASMIDVSVRLLPDAPAPMKHRTPVRFHLGSSEIIGNLYLLEGEALEPGEATVAQLRLSEPTLCFPGDRFVLRRYSPLTTVGGGIVLDNRPSKHRKKELARTMPRLKRLEEALVVAGADSIQSLLLHVVEASEGDGADIRALVSRTGYTPETIKQRLPSLPSISLIPQEPLLAVSLEYLEHLKDGIADFLTAFHDQNPLAAGVSKEEVKRRFLPGGSNVYFQFLLDNLAAESRIEIRGSLLSSHGQTVDLTPSQEAIREALLSRLRETPFAAPSLEELTKQVRGSESEVREIYYFLLAQKQILRVAEGIVILPEHLQKLKADVAKAFPPGKATFSVPEFKDLISVSRKYAIPLLEFLDRERVTRRVGDRREVVE